MSITFPKSWTTNDKLLSSDVQANLEEIVKKGQKIGGSDVTTSAWLETKHIVKPDYNPVTNITSNVSGVFGGDGSKGFFSRSSYVTRWLSGSSSRTFRVIPGTTKNLDIHRSANVLFQWWVTVLSENDVDGTDGFAFIKPYFGTPDGTQGIEHRFPEQPDSSSHNALVDGSFHSSGFCMRTLTGENLNYPIGLCGHSSAGRNRLISWGVSVEVFYI